MNALPRFCCSPLFQQLQVKKMKLSNARASILSALLAIAGGTTRADAFVLSRQPPRHFCTQTQIRSSDDANEREDSPTSELPRIIETRGVPIYLYTDDIELEAIEQLRVLAESPVPVDYVSAMPDAHLGKGVTIGSVFASEKYVCPNAVGVDIGCGMAAVPIDGLYKNQLTNDQMNEIQRLIKEQIPTGFEQHRKTLEGTHEVLTQITDEVEPTQYLKDQLMEPRVADQLGTLGGGNHFLEVVYEEGTEQVWIMLHSGSRNIGNRVATRYDQVAKHLLLSQGVDTQPLRGIHYMPIDSQEGQDYLRDMEWCQRYAFHNRQAMQKIMEKIVEKVTGKYANVAKGTNIHHNYCACEDCDGRKLWITRKGATSAKVGEYGIIPGSMGTGSYITRGRGNLLSWNSSSHGAGRRMSRTKAKAEISQSDFEDVMKGIVCDTTPAVKDEAPQAYKDLNVVMKNQESLTDVVHHLLPLINVKGFEEKSNKLRRSSSSTPKSKEQKLKERRKLIERQAERNLKSIKSLLSKLETSDFLEKAPAEVVEHTKAALDKRRKRQEALLRNLDDVNKGLLL